MLLLPTMGGQPIKHRTFLSKAWSSEKNLMSN